MDADGRTVWLRSMVDGCLAWSGARKHKPPEERVNPATMGHFGSSHLNGGLRTHLLAVLRYGRATGIESTAFGGGEGLAFPLLRSQSHETRNPMRHP